MTNTKSEWFGHPKGLFILFMTEMWERFTFYGMRALLILFMTSQMNFGDSKANLTYGAYQAFVYTMPVWGGWLADKLIGQRISIMWGGIMMAIGNFTLAIPGDTAFFLGLGMIIMGNGYFKPNISTMVGDLYAENDERRDSGFSIFYMGINVGATLGGLLCGYVGQTYSWHLGFALAGFFMLLGLMVFTKGQSTLGNIGLPPENTQMNRKVLSFLSLKNAILILSVLMVPVFAFLLVNYKMINYIINPIGIIMLAYVIYFGFKEGKVAFGRLMVALVLIFFSMLFWAFYEQGGGSLNLYAARNVNMNFLGLHLSSAAVNNSINGAMVVLLSPVFGWLWVKLAKMNANPNSIVKFGLGLVLLGIGFYMFVVGAQTAENGMVNLFWFAMGYFFMTTGELCLSPIGLSAITKLSPPKMVGLMMGMWFLASAFGQYLAGIIGTLMAIPAESDTGVKMAATESLPIYTGIFSQITMVSVACGVLLLLISPILRKHMHGVK